VRNYGDFLKGEIHNYSPKLKKSHGQVERLVRGKKSENVLFNGWGYRQPMCRL
jgi:hypothetical protein